jgi:hypothetical protein
VYCWLRWKKAGSWTIAYHRQMNAASDVLTLLEAVF